MSIELLERRLERGIERVGGNFVDAGRAVRFLEYLTVGASGAAIDVALTASLLASTHYLLANAAGFLTANSWNFVWNRWITFDSPDGAVTRQYPAYLAWHAATFGVRAVTIVVLVESGGVPVLFASVVGIGAASIANFAGSERIFGTSTASPDQLRVAVGQATSRVAHVIYTERVQSAIETAGLYAPLYGLYQWILGRLYPDDQLVIEAGGATATVHLEDDAEVASIDHTLQEEGWALEEFVSAIHEEDVVWDVGANLGVFSLLASDRAEHVVAVEPYPPNASRLRDNAELSGSSKVEVLEVALGEEEQTVELGIDREERGTQTPAVGPETGQSTIEVEQVRGDCLIELEDLAPPTVVKIDVEGAEQSVIEGFEQALDHDRCRLVYLEEHSALWGGQKACEQVKQRLQSLGFLVKRVDGRRGQTYFRGVKR